MNLVEYASSYERAGIYRLHAPPGDVEFHVDCPAALDRVAERGYYVITQCRGGFTDPDGRSGHFAADRSFYFINDTVAIRISTEDDDLNDTPSEATGGFDIVNFDDRNHIIQIQVREMDADSNSFVVDRPFELEDWTGLRRFRVAIPGRYVVIAAGENDELARYEWNLTADPATQTTPVVYVATTGEILIRPLPDPSSESKSLKWDSIKRLVITPVGDALICITVCAFSVLAIIAE